MPNRSSPARLPPVLGLCLALGACGLPPGGDVPISETAAATPAPRLGETASFDAALASATPDARRLDADTEALAARAAALRARAAALAAPVVDPADRARLETAPRNE